MRILFVGAGATGGYFGGRLQQAGKDVTFLVRPGRAGVLRSRGLRIKGPDGDVVLQPRLVTSGEVQGPYDVVVLAVKSYALDQAIRDATPAVGPRTVVIPLLNGVRHVDRLVAAFGPERAWGGTCMVQATLDADGDVVKMSGMHRLSYGPLDGLPDDRLPAVTEALSGEEFDSNPSLTILQDLWEKWIYLATVAAANVLMRGSIGAINAAPGGPAFTTAIGDESSAIARAAGHAQREGALAFFRRELASAKPTTTSLFRDLSAGLPIEGDVILGDLVAVAAEHGVDAPLLAAAHTNLGVYAARRAAG